MSDRPNFLILMVDQLTGTFWEDGPADFLDVPHLRALHERSVNFSSCYTPSPLCTPGARLVHDGAAALGHDRLRQRRGVSVEPADLGALPAPGGLVHRAVGQDALRRRRPAARFRGPAHHRHLPRRLRLDARLGPPLRARRLVVPQPVVGHGSRRRADQQPARVRRRGRLVRAPEAAAARAAHRSAPVLPVRELHPPARPVHRAPRAVGALRGRGHPDADRGRAARRSARPAHEAAVRRGRRVALHDHAGEHPGCPPRVLREPVVSRRPGRRAAGDARRDGLRRRHGRRVLRRPRRHARQSGGSGTR